MGRSWGKWTWDLNEVHLKKNFYCPVIIDGQHEYWQFLNLFNTTVTWSGGPESVAAELAVGAVVLNVEAAVVEVVEGLVAGVAILLAFVFSSVKVWKGYSAFRLLRRHILCQTAFCDISCHPIWTQNDNFVQGSPDNMTPDNMTIAQYGSFFIPIMDLLIEKIIGWYDKRFVWHFSHSPRVSY